MAEYIDREALKEAFKSVTDDCTCPIHLAAEIDQILDQSPVADVAPVRHGQWIETPRLCYGAKQYECSLCYSDTFWNKHSIYEKYPHCPNCGAKMGLED